MYTENTGIEQDTTQDGTWTLKNLAIVAAVVFVYPALMYLASAISLPGCEGDVEYTPTPVNVNADSTNNANVSNTATGSIGARPVGTHHEACPHVRKGVSGSCCGQGLRQRETDVSSRK